MAGIQAWFRVDDLAATVWILAFAGMTGANRSGGATMVALNLAPTCPRKPIKGKGFVVPVFTGMTSRLFWLDAIR